MIYPKSPIEVAVLMEDRQLIPNWKEEFKQAWIESRKPEIFYKDVNDDPFSDIEDESENHKFTLDGIPDEIVKKGILYINYPKLTHWYAHEIIRGRWLEAEEIIKQNPESAYWYAHGVIKDRWPEAEDVIKQNPTYWHQYCREFIK